MRGVVSLTEHQRMAAELLNDAFFEISPEAKFLLRVSAVEALCPQANQPKAFKANVYAVIAAIPAEVPHSDRNTIKQHLKSLAARQSARSAYMPKIRRLIGQDKATEFEILYDKRSKFVHEGQGRASLGTAPDDALEIGLELLLADIAQAASQK